LYKAVFQNADHIFSQSTLMKNKLVRKGIDNTKISVIPMGVDLSFFKKIKPDYYYKKKFKKFFKIVYLGAIDKYRNTDFFLYIIKRLVEAKIPVMLFVIGDSTDKNQLCYLKKLAVNLSIEKNVIFTGWIDRTKALSISKNADIGVNALPDNYIFNSMSPTKTIEYLTMDIPIVVHRHPDHNDIFKHCKYGILCEYSVSEFFKSIKSIYYHKDEFLKHKNDAFLYLNRFRNYEVISNKLSIIYNSFIIKNDL
jgi:glycosyltransferase involved in cell wall biosynthesis